MLREGNDIAPDTVEYRHGLTPPMRDARRRRFRRKPDRNVRCFSYFNPFLENPCCYLICVHMDVNLKLFYSRAAGGCSACGERSLEYYAK